MNNEKLLRQMALESQKKTLLFSIDNIGNKWLEHIQNLNNFSKI